MPDAGHVKTKNCEAEGKEGKGEEGMGGDLISAMPCSGTSVVFRRRG